jgi:hypothetical protein
MTDKREAILERIAAITTETKTGAGLVACVRNRGLIATDKRPAAVLLDGDEKPAIFRPNAATDSRSTFRPALMRMSPELYILMDEPLPLNDAARVDLGSALNAKRIALSNAITSDAALKTLLGSNGGIVYNGCVTDLKSGSALTGQMRLDFIYIYFFDPSA